MLTGNDETNDWRRGLEARFGSALRRFFMRRLHNDEEARELTQELYLRVLATDGAICARNPDAYIFMTASNLVRERWRRQAVGPTTSLVEGEDCQTDPGRIESVTPERVLLGKAALIQAVAAIEELNPTTRAIFILHRLEGMRQKDIASRLGLSVSAVEKRFASALTYLARRMEE